MARPTHVVCFSCHQGQERELKKSFLGFPSFRCESCGASSAYPLSTAYVVIYGASFALCLLATIARRGVGCFLILALAAIPAIALDMRARRKARFAEAHEKSRGERLAEPFR